MYINVYQYCLRNFHTHTHTQNYDIVHIRFLEIHCNVTRSLLYLVFSFYSFINRASCSLDCPWVFSVKKAICGLHFLIFCLNAEIAGMWYHAWIVFWDVFLHLDFQMNWIEILKNCKGFQSFCSTRWQMHSRSICCGSIIIVQSLFLL